MSSQQETSVTSAARVAIITGGASGMGRVMALRLSRSGYRVAIVDRNEQALAELCREPGLTPYACDVSDWEQVQAVVARIQSELGPVARLATAAAIMPAQSVAASAAEAFAKTMQVNYVGTVNFVKAVLPQMQAGNSGEIVLFGSLAGVIPVDHFSAYGATKAAVNFFGQVLASELAGSGIKVLTVRPGAVNTPLISQAGGDGGLKGLVRQSQSGKLISPDVIIDAIERGLERKVSIVYPTAQVGIAQLLYRLFPKFASKLANADVN